MIQNQKNHIIFKIFNIAIKLFLGGMLFYGGVQKFQKPIPSPSSIIEQVQAGENVAPNVEVLKIKNYIFGMKQTNYFWQFLGLAELLAGALILSQIFWILGSFIALPITINIFLFHLFLETDDTFDLLMTMALLVINIWFLMASFDKWKAIIIDKTAVDLKSK